MLNPETSYKELLQEQLYSHPEIFLIHLRPYSDSPLKDSNYHTGETVERNLIRQLRYYRFKEYPNYILVLQDVKLFTLLIETERKSIDLREFEKKEGPEGILEKFVEARERG